MNMIQYKTNDRCIGSRLIGGNIYTVLSTEEEYETSLLEEILDPVRQRAGRKYLRVRAQSDGTEFWMVPIEMKQEQTERFLDAVEELMTSGSGGEKILAPVDVVSDGEVTGYLIRPIDRTVLRSLRSLMPAVSGRQWRTACSLFSAVKQLHSLGLTSNGFSREQVRVCADGEIVLWLSDTVSSVEGTDDSECAVCHEGFLSLPVAVEKACGQEGIGIDGRKRDLFSAAVSAFYLILHSHPFVGSAFNGLLREDYLLTYLHMPRYIMATDTDNGLGNQKLGRFVAERWGQTAPALKRLFDQMFSVIDHPELMVDDEAECWNPDRWVDALQEDEARNSEAVSRMEINFKNEAYHLV